MTIRRISVPREKKRKEKVTKRKLPRSRGVYLKRKFFESDAFWNLNSTAIKVLFVFYFKRHLDPEKAIKLGYPDDYIFNNGKITFPYPEAKGYGISDSAFRDAIDVLIDRGFIEINEKDSEDKQMYWIIDKWKSYPDIDVKYRTIHNSGFGGKFKRKAKS